MPLLATATSLWSTDLTGVFDSAFAIVESDVVTGVSTALPYGLAIAGLLLAIRLCISFFRSVAH